MKQRGKSAFAITVAAIIWAGSALTGYAASSDAQDRKDAREVEDYMDFEEDYAAVYNNTRNGTQSMKVGETLDLLPFTFFENRVGAVTWTSSKTDTATVSSNGKVTALKPGFANITVKYTDNRGRRKTITTHIKITDENGSYSGESVPTTGDSGYAVSTPSGGQYFFTVEEGKVLHLGALLYSGAEAGTVAWASDNSRVAVVDDAGKVTTKEAGVSNLTATRTLSDGTQQVQKVKVQAVSAYRSGLPKECTVYVQQGGKVDLREILYPGYNGTSTYGAVKWSGSDDAIATVDSDGVVRAVAVAGSTCTVSSSHTDYNDRSTRYKIKIIVG